jgi:anaerobic ribonucleoside-triphosphate reductase activating protein
VALDVKDDEIRLAGPIQSDSIVDGEGLRAVVWCQGCYRACPGCHNPESWDDHGGEVVKIDWVKNQLRELKGQAGLTFSGGEPMLQAKACKEIADWARKELGWNIWSFTGFTYEDIRDGKEWATPDMWELVKSLDVLMDGPFVLAERDLSIKFRGSRNQRLLRLKNGKITAIE